MAKSTRMTTDLLANIFIAWAAGCDDDEPSRKRTARAL